MEDGVESVSLAVALFHRVSPLHGKFQRVLPGRSANK